jgi:hypothetical protein
MTNQRGDAILSGGGAGRPSSYDGGLPAGAQATVLPVDLSFDDALLGPQQIGAVVSPAGGETEDALVNNRSSHTTTLSAPPVETTTPVTAPATAPVTAPAAAPAAATSVTAAAATPPAVLPFTGVGTAERTALGVLLVLAGIGLLLAGRARPALRTA